MIKRIVLATSILMSFLGAAHGETTVVKATEAEVQELMAAIETPSNALGVVFKAAVKSAKNISKAANTKFEVSATKNVGEPTTYFLEIKVKPGQDLSFSNNNEGADLIAEVIVNQGKAYVVGFTAERAQNIIKYPGVGMGNQ